MVRRLVVLLVACVALQACGGAEPASSRYIAEDDTISRDEAISDHWDDICEHLDGSETLEACDQSSGNCYDLEAEISSCNIDTVRFPNGGFLSPGEPIDNS